MKSVIKNAWKHRRIGIHARISITTIVISSVVALTVLFVSLYFLEQHIRTIVKNEQYARLEGISRVIEQKFESRRYLLGAFAKAIPRNTFQNLDELQKYVLQGVDTKAQFDNIAILDAKGTLIANHNGPRGIGTYNLKDREYFRKTIETKAGLISKPVINKFTKVPQLFMTQPILGPTGEVEYVVLGAIYLERQTFLGHVANTKFGRTGYVFIFNTDKTVIFHPRPGRVMRPLDADGKKNIATEQALGGFEGTTEAVNRYGIYGLYSFKRIKETDWILGAFYPKAEALETLTQVKLSAAVSAALLSIFAGLVSALMMKRHLQPLLELHSHMQESMLPNSKPHQIVFNDDEIGDIGKVYFRLTEINTQFAAELQKKERRVRNILHQASDAYVECAFDGTITEWNRQAEETFGWAKSEVVGRKLEELIIPAEARQAHAEGMARFAKTGTGPVVNKRVEIVGLCRDGRLIPIELSVGAIREGDQYWANAFIRDITKQNEAKLQLANSEDFLRSVTNNIPAMVGFVDRTETYRFANNGYFTLFGVHPTDVIGRTMLEVLGPVLYQSNREQIAQALSGKRVHFERDVAIQGKLHHFMTDYIPSPRESGTSEGFLIMVTDISQRKQSELKQAENEKAAAAASRAKSEFVANMSHEIRTPLNAVLGLTHLLQKTSISQIQLDYLKMIRASGSSLLNVINDVLDYSKIEAGKLDIVELQFELNDVLSNIASIMSVNIEDKFIEPIITVAPDVPKSLVGDANRLQQVLVNLVNNAIKFTEAGEVLLRVACRKLDSGKVDLEFSVEDTGIGMAPEHLARLFAPFEQADASTSRRYGGTGLGLAITSRLVHMLGGGIQVSSELNNGSTFTVNIPFGASSTSATYSAALGNNALRVLVVDDNETFLTQLTKYFGMLNIDVASCVTPKEAKMVAMELLSKERFIDAVILDSGFAAMPGAAPAYEELVAFLNDKKIRVILTSQLVNSYGISEAHWGAHVLIKPLIFDSLSEILIEGRALPSPKNAVHSPKRAELDGLRILLVEDNELNRLVALTMLQSVGAVVETAENGAVAVETLRSRPDAFGIVLMDVQMPVMDGYQATICIRQQLGLVLPIIAMTAGVMASEKQQCLVVGMDGFVSKPLEFPLMVQAILECVVGKASGQKTPFAQHTEGTSERLASTKTEALFTLDKYIFEKEVFDIGPLLQLNEGDLNGKAIFADLVAKIASKSTGELERAKQDFSNRSYEDASRRLHSLRGSVGSLGADRFCTSTLALEQHIREGSDNTEKMFAVVELELERTLSSARNWLAGMEVDSENIGQYALSNVKADIEELKFLLAEQDMAAIEKFEVLRSYFLEQLPAEDYIRLCEYISALDFVSTLSCINSFKLQRSEVT